MKTNTKKAKTYRVVCELEKTVDVREFAEKHTAVGAVAEVRVYGRMFSKHPRVIISFKSNESETNIYKAFMEEFNNYDVKINGRNMTINKRVKFY